MHPKERIVELTDRIKHHNYQYYQNSVSEISDFEFDKMLKELYELENQYPEFKLFDSPTERVGGEVTKAFKTVKHTHPMLSLSNTYSHDELLEFDARVKKLLNTEYEYICEQKFDGVAISLIYENGKLKQAITRGDGTKGDDITANAKTIRSIPLNVQGNDFPPYFEVRGEVFFPLKSFEKLNKEQEENGDPLYANPRNTASGTLKLHDSAEVARRGLDCFCYALLGDDLPYPSHEKSIKMLEQWGFNVSKTYRKCDDINDVWEYIKEWETLRFQLPLATDGVVAKVNSFNQQEILGLTAKSPRWAIAFKYKAQTAFTLLESVTYQIGRTGAITPVANMKPVQLAGTTVKRATLHNANEIVRLDLHEGDWVNVEKSGEIIPKITTVDISKRDPNSKRIEFITNCPECNTLLERKPEEAIWFCPNEKGCPTQLKGKIIHFIHRKAMGIEGMGAETIELFYERGLVHNYADLYDLKYEDILGLDRFAQKSAQNVIDGLKQSKEIPFERVLFALGIKFVGYTVSEKLAKYFKNIENLKKATLEELVLVPEIGIKIAESVVNWFTDSDNIEMLDRLKQAGLQFKIEEKEVITESEKLKGKSFVISGVFETFSREELQDKITANGGRILSGISGKLDFLVAGENMGPAKLEKATKLGVKIISEADFTQLLL